jgi:hypothetical protein
MTPSSNETLERIARRIPIPEPAYERMLRRRDRKRRNQRIRGGVVGIAVFVAAIWIVTTGLPFDQSQTEGVPGGAGAGTGQTGATETGPTVTGPVIGPTGDPFSEGFNGLPPEGATPSEPPQGELVMSEMGIHPWWQVNVYADGRLIWARQRKNFEEDNEISSWIEQRLTPEGVELLRSGAVPLGGQFENPGEQLPVSAWEDPKLRPYVPSKYAAFVYGVDKILPLLPEAVADLLRGAQRTGEVTTEDARALVGALTAAGFEESCCNGSGYVDAVVVFDSKGPSIEFASLLPDGTLFETGG